MQMQYLVQNPFFVCGLAMAVSIGFTFAVRGFAHKIGQVAKPKSDRWHKRPTAMLGGVGIFLTVVVLYAFLSPKNTDSLVILGGSTFLFVIGLIDDLLDIKPYQKLVGQLIGAVIIVGFGLRLPLTGSEVIDSAITVFWVVAITNAINLLDNMDGLSAGIAAIAAISLAIGFWNHGQLSDALLISIFIGALLGFLVFNFNPASIFMGDCGSMFVGFFLASSVLLSDIGGGRSRGIFTILAVPVLILFVPIFDTTFVTILRKLWGRKASQGGRDHTSHRLVALGLSERSAVLMIYGFAIAAGVLALMVSQLRVTQSLALIAIFTVALSLIGVYLSKVRVYDQTEEELASKNNAMYAFLVDVSHKRRIFEVFLDLILIAVCYYASYIIIFGPIEASGEWPVFSKSLPLIVILKLFAFLISGVYRGLWRYTGLSDLIIFTRGVVLASVFSVFGILLLWRFEGFSRTVFVVDGLLLLLAVFGSRLTFRLIRELLPGSNGERTRRVLIYGAGDGGEMVLRELRNNAEFGYQPVCFVDDDPLKRGRVISGLKVYPSDDGIGGLCEKMEISEMLISFRNADDEKLEELKDICRGLNITLKRAEFRIETVDLD